MGEINHFFWISTNNLIYFKDFRLPTINIWHQGSKSKEFGRAKSKKYSRNRKIPDSDWAWRCLSNPKDYFNINGP